MFRAAWSGGLFLLACWTTTTLAAASPPKHEEPELLERLRSPSATSRTAAPRDVAAPGHVLVERLKERGAAYEISWFTIDGGGGTSQGGTYRWTGTIGQPDAGRAAAGSYVLLGGFMALEPLLSTIELSLTVSPTSLAEPGGSASVTLQIDNTGDTQVMVTALSDDALGDLDGQGSCELPQTLDVAASYSCVYDAPFPGNAGDLPTRIVNVAGSGPASPVAASASASVLLTDVLPAIGVVKMASPTELPAPGGEVIFSVSVANTGGIEAVTLTGLIDDIHGDVNGQGDCVVPQMLEVATTYACEFPAVVSGEPGDVEVDTVMATAIDDEGNAVQASDTATVTLGNALADLAIAKSDGRSFIEPGGSLAYTIDVANHGPSSVVGATLMDPLPSGLLDCQWSCVASLGVCTAVGTGDVVDTIDLEAGGFLTYTLECDVDPEATGVLVNTATIEVPAGVDDTDPANNSASDQTEVATPLFSDDFESGDPSAWSSVIGMTVDQQP